ncbi:MAG: sulfotransferase [Proteobacteria bacterium]|nr:sulfotransferase [Pseudomonadota bacterium]
MDFEESLQAVQPLIGQQKLNEADATIDQLLQSQPRHVEALFTKAVIKRLLNQPEDAQQALDALHAIDPQHSRAFQEKGHHRMAKRELQPAIEAYESAVARDPALIISWKALIGLHAMAENAEGAGRAKAHVERLQALPQELLNISSLINEKRFYKAEPLCRQFLQQDPHNVEAMRLLAAIAGEMGVTDDAEQLLEAALKFDPGFHLGRFDYVGVLQKRQKFKDAFKHAGYLKESKPDDFNFQRLYANSCINVGHYEEAIEIYNKVLAVDPENPQILLMCGHAAKTIGRIEEGIDYYRRCYTAKPDYGDAFWSLANLKTYALTDDELATAQRSEAASQTTVTDRIHLCFALGKAFEDRSNFSLSFGYYERGNRLKLTELAYHSDLVTTEVDAQIAVCDAALIEAKSTFGHPAPDPIFIVGLPRSGSTLLEQILASHSEIDGTFELPNILNAVVKLNGRRMKGDTANYPDVLHELTDEQFSELGKSYIEETRAYRADAPFFTDKMPNNFRHIGLIKLILPNAKIIDARREPMALCFSCFKQLFAKGQAYTYGLQEIGQYYRDYVRLMDHWEQLFPGQILRVQYEDVVADLKNEVSRMLEFCGLEMQPACLEYHKTDRPVRTPSSEQVRQPIYQRGLRQWREYEDFLEPLRSALGKELTP